MDALRDAFTGKSKLSDLKDLDNRGSVLSRAAHRGTVPDFRCRLGARLSGQRFRREP